MAMTRRDVIGGLTAGAMSAMLPGRARAASGRPPNFIVILADDMGWGDARCYGNPYVRTPYIDALARQGTLFTHGYAAATVCSPSRAAILTGRFPSRDRIFSWLGFDQKRPTLNKDRGVADFLDPAIPTLASHLRAAGYANGLFGKWHVGQGAGAPEPSAYGFDAYRVASGNGPYYPQHPEPFRPHSSQLITDESIRFVEANADRPFCLQVWYLDPHVPLSPSAEELKAYEGVGGALQTYLAAMTAMDAHIGRLLTRLDELKLARDTVVVFTSDNGPVSMMQPNEPTTGAGLAGPFRGQKGSLYEGGIRVPFIVRWPGVTPAGRVDELTAASGVDLLPTFCALAGAPVDPEGIDGVDLSAAFRGTPTSRPEPLMWEWRSPQSTTPPMHVSPMLAIRWQSWKLLMNPDGSRVELYDVVKDTLEVDNLAKDNPSVVDLLQAPLIAWFHALPDAPLPANAGRIMYPWPKPSTR